MPKRLYFLAFAAIAACAMWLWVQQVAIPHQQSEAASLGAPRGNLSDLYPRWLGARELLLHHRNPYSPDVTREIQIGYYGRALDPSRPHDPKDQQAFAYPLYVVFILAPSVTLPFAVVQHLFLWLLAILTAVTVPLWARALNLNLSAISIVAWIIFVLGSFPAIQGLKLQQLTLLAAGLLALAFAALMRRHLVWAGILLALASIKPQLVFLVILWLAIWTLGAWRERQKLLWSFAIAMAVLVLGAELLLPGWIHEFRAASAAYYQYTGGGRSVLDVLMTPLVGRILSAILVIALLAALWHLRRTPEATPEFRYSLALVMATTLVVIPMFAPYNQLLLLPALLLTAHAIPHLWTRSRLSRFLLAITAVAIFWPWIAAFALVVSQLFLPPATVQKGWALPIYTSLAIPIVVLALLWMTRNALRQSKS